MAGSVGAFLRPYQLAGTGRPEVGRELEKIAHGVAEAGFGDERRSDDPDKSGGYRLGLEVGGAKGIVAGAFGEARARAGAESLRLGEGVPAEGVEVAEKQWSTRMSN